MGRCYLEGITPCSGPITREHIVSKSVLSKVFTEGKGLISGTPWSSETGTIVSVESFSAKVLCAGHNSSLSHLDEIAGEFFRCLQEAQIDLANKSSTSLRFEFDGSMLERWMLKLVLGMHASNNFANGGGKLSESISEICKPILLGGPFPEFWGLYIQPPNGEFSITDKEFWCEPLTGSGLVRAVRFGIARIPFCLVLGRPDDPSFWGKFRPTHFKLQSGEVERLFSFRWDTGPSSGGVSFIRLRDS